MADLKCYQDYSSECEFHDYVEVPSGKGRTQEDGVNLFCYLTHLDICVTTKEDIDRLKNMGFNKFVLTASLADQKYIKKFELDNGDIILELSKELILGDDLKAKLSEWIRGGVGFAGGAPGAFYAVCFGEPHELDENREECYRAYIRAVTIIHEVELGDGTTPKLKQNIALGAYVLPLGFDKTWKNEFYGFESLADILMYTGYDGPWYATGGMGDSDQRVGWEHMKEIANGRSAYPYIILSRYYNEKMHEYTDVDYLDTHLKTAKSKFNGAAAYPSEIVKEFVHKLGEICNLHDYYGSKDIWKIPSDLEPELKKLLQGSAAFGAMIRCICDRRGKLGHEVEHLTKIDKETGGCTERDLEVLKNAYCEMYWRRLEMFCAAAERQKLLKQQTMKQTKQIYYCAKSDCRECRGTNPVDRSDLWLNSPLPRCPKPIEKLDSR